MTEKNDKLENEIKDIKMRYQLSHEKLSADGKISQDTLDAIKESLSSDVEILRQHVNQIKGD